MTTNASYGSGLTLSSQETRTLRAPFPWYGGKSLAAPMIWRSFGNVPNFVDPFAGSLAVLLARPHAPKVETINDKDGFIANVWRSIQHDPEGVAQWCDWPVNEADLHARHRWLVKDGVPLLERLIDDPDYYDVKVAGWWIWGVCTWIGNGWCHKDERVQKQKRRPEINAANGRGVHAVHKTAEDDCQRRRPHLSSANGQGVEAIVKASGPISVPQYLSLPKIGTPGHGIHAPSRKMPRNARGATGIHQVTPPAGKKPATTRGKGIHANSSHGGLVDLFAGLSERLRHVRVCCGDWKRVLGRSTLGIDTDHGMTPCGVLLDPPYDHELRDKRLYREDEAGISADVRQWCIDNGDNPALRIALCGQRGEHAMPASWTEVAWASTSSAKSRSEERIWFSPHCLAAVAQTEMFA